MRALDCRPVRQRSVRARVSSKVAKDTAWTEGGGEGGTRNSAVSSALSLIMREWSLDIFDWGWERGGGGDFFFKGFVVSWLQMFKNKGLI